MSIDSATYVRDFISKSYPDLYSSAALTEDKFATCRRVCRNTWPHLEVSCDSICDRILNQLDNNQKPCYELGYCLSTEVLEKLQRERPQQTITTKPAEPTKQVYYQAKDYSEENKRYQESEKQRPVEVERVKTSKPRTDPTSYIPSWVAEDDYKTKFQMCERELYRVHQEVEAEEQKRLFCNEELANCRSFVDTVVNAEEQAERKTSSNYRNSRPSNLQHSTKTTAKEATTTSTTRSSSGESSILSFFVFFVALLYQLGIGPVLLRIEESIDFNNPSTVELRLWQITKLGYLSVFLKHAIMVLVAYSYLGSEYAFMFGFNSSYDRWTRVYPCPYGISYLISAELGLRVGHIIVNRSKLTSDWQFHWMQTIQSVLFLLLSSSAFNWREISYIVLLFHSGNAIINFLILLDLNKVVRIDFVQGILNFFRCFFLMGILSMVSDQVSALFMIIGLGIFVLSAYESYEDLQFMWKKYKKQN